MDYVAELLSSDHTANSSHSKLHTDFSVTSWVCVLVTVWQIDCVHYVVQLYMGESGT